MFSTTTFLIRKTRDRQAGHEVIRREHLLQALWPFSQMMSMGGIMYSRQTGHSKSSRMLVLRSSVAAGAACLVVIDSVVVGVESANKN